MKTPVKTLMTGSPIAIEFRACRMRPIPLIAPPAADAARE